MNSFSDKIPECDLVILAGLSPNKRRILRKLLPGRIISAASRQISMADRMILLSEKKKGARYVILTWQEPCARLRDFATEHGIPLGRVEDGFIRSAGLGIELANPASYTVDFGAMHYDVSGRSDLERDIIRASANVSEFEAMGRELREALISSRVSKYGAGSEGVNWPDAAGRKRILVVGQVEGDASLLYGSPLIRTNLDLIAAVRSENPGAQIIYRPHPDVTAGLRAGSVSSDALSELADVVCPHSSLHAAIAAADEVHVMTSQAGFDALMLGRPVHCYGAPFYAYWGLTTDHPYGDAANPAEDRARSRLSVDALVGVVIGHYPAYFHPVTFEPISAHEAIRLISLSSEGAFRWPSAPWYHRLGVKLARIRNMLK